ncbi:MAG: ElyC/SanA/YdcF family protein [Patescibacteria group bacterium]
MDETSVPPLSRRTMHSALLGIAILSALVAVNTLYISLSSERYLYTDVNTVPEYAAGLLLGTSRRSIGGELSQFFDNRINAAVALYRAGKIKEIVVSGDNSTKYYNEPVAMQKTLLERGIPEEDIHLDYAGFNTYDSIARMYHIFGQTEFLIISQRFHSERAVFIAHSLELPAAAFTATPVEGMIGFRANVREIGARIKMWFDVFPRREPKFLGETIDIEAQ